MYYINHSKISFRAAFLNYIIHLLLQTIMFCFSCLFIFILVDMSIRKEVWFTVTVMQVQLLSLIPVLPLYVCFCVSFWMCLCRDKWTVSGGTRVSVSLSVCLSLIQHKPSESNQIPMLPLTLVINIKQKSRLIFFFFLFSRFPQKHRYIFVTSVIVSVKRQFTNNNVHTM